MRILHCFNWKLKDIIGILEECKQQGFDAIQINPIQPLKEEGLKEWWMSYQPRDFDIGNYYGTKEDLINLCNIANEYDIQIFADVILNHMGASKDNQLESHESVNPRLLKKEYWKEKQNVTDWHDRQDVINHCIKLPGLNVYHPDVENMIVDFLNDLIDCGVNGFRFDAAKSIGLPSEGYRFWPNIIYRLKKYGLFLYGEVVFEENQDVLNEYSNYMNLLGNYDCKDQSKMVKYIETHDTYLSDEFGYSKYWSSDYIINEYCNLTNYYDNTIFYIRPFDDSWKDERIKKAHIKKVLRKEIK